MIRALTIEEWNHEMSTCVERLVELTFDINLSHFSFPGGNLPHLTSSLIPSSAQTKPVMINNGYVMTSVDKRIYDDE